MKVLVTIVRILTGLLFVFSGMVKAIDPRGLAYKMQEFFEAWSASGFMPSMMSRLNSYALTFSIIMITLEVAVGVALLLGWQKRLTVWLLTLLMIFFTFLTSYVLFTGKIRACGCFGDCIPLTPVQTFTKDIILLTMCIFLLFTLRYIRPVAKPWINTIYLVVLVAIALSVQFRALDHLPVKDCLPFRAGNNLLELRKMPANAIQDQYDYAFVYQKGNEKKEFRTDALPDSSWTFVERKQVLVKAGSNNVPLINDFSLTATDGSDSTEAILSQPGTYYLLFMREVPSAKGNWINDLRTFLDRNQGSRPVYIITAQREAVQKFLAANQIQPTGIYITDATAIKTAARTNPAIFIMQGPVVQAKYGYADFDRIP